jgi:hypothetical protein
VFLSDTPTVEASLHGAWWSSGHDDPHAVPHPSSVEGGALMPRFDSARYQALLTQESARHAQAMAGLLSQAQVADQVVPPLPGFPGLPAPAAPPQVDPATGLPVAAAPAPAPAAPAWPAPAAPAPPAPAPAAPAGYAFDPVSQQYVPTAPVPAVQPAPVPVPAPQPFAGVPGYPPAPAAPAQPWPPAPAPAVPAAPAPAAPAPGYPAGFTAPAPAAPAAPTPGAVPPPAPSPLVAQLSAGQLAELQARAARGEQAMMALEAQQREHYLSTAVNEGRISVAERNAWATQMAQPNMMAPTVALLSSLTPGRVPVAPVGQAALAAGNATAGVPDAACLGAGDVRHVRARSRRPGAAVADRRPRRRRTDRSLTHAGTRSAVPEQLDPVLGRRRRDHLPRRRWAGPGLPVRRDHRQPGRRTGQPGRRALPRQRRRVRRQRAGPRRDRRDRTGRRHGVALQVEDRRGQGRGCPGRLRAAGVLAAGDLVASDATGQAVPFAGAAAGAVSQGTVVFDAAIGDQAAIDRSVGAGRVHA